jgi:Ni/Co efflux regulator RcnB
MKKITTLALALIFAVVAMPLVQAQDAAKSEVKKADTQTTAKADKKAAPKAAKKNTAKKKAAPKTDTAKTAETAK